MAQSYIGEIRMFGGNFAPAGWQFCDGRLLPISEYETLFSLIGTTYGGDGQSTFGLPDLRGRVPIHQGNGPGQNFPLAVTGGVETVAVTANQMPAHSHPLLAAGVQGGDNAPTGNVPAISENVKLYINESTDGALNAASIGSAGGTQPHENRQPFLALSFIISLFGVYPAQA